MGAHRVTRSFVALLIGFVALVPWPSAAQEPIRIGASTSMTGAYAKPGTYFREGYCSVRSTSTSRGDCWGEEWSSFSVRRRSEEFLKLRTRTAFGDYAVDERGFQTGHRMVTIQWQDGKQIVVWPDELANGKARFPMPRWDQR